MIKKKPYEKPQLISLSNNAKGFGYCEPGTSNTNCFGGNTPSSGCGVGLDAGNCNTMGVSP